MRMSVWMENEWNESLWWYIKSFASVNVMEGCCGERKCRLWDSWKQCYRLLSSLPSPPPPLALASYDLRIDRNKWQREYHILSLLFLVVITTSTPTFTNNIKKITKEINCGVTRVLKSNISFFPSRPLPYETFPWYIFLLNL